MLHQIETESLGSHGTAMTRAVEACVHCGFCLPTCPTYEVLGEEMDSPRGRIFLMKEVLEARLPLQDALPYVDRCLGCVACTTACPSGVDYGELLTPFRMRAEKLRRRTLMNRLLRTLVLQTLPYPARFSLAARLGRRFRPLGEWRWLPRQLRALLQLVPDSLPPRQRWAGTYPALGQRLARVGLLPTCAQQVLAPGITQATVALLTASGAEVVVPAQAGCCGALAAHTGAAGMATRMARATMQAFPQDLDYVVTNAAGCGSGMREYPLWLAGDASAERATRFAGQVRDVSEVVLELGPPELEPRDRPTRVAYHDACHLAHAQGVRAAPRALLSRVGNLEVVEIPQGELCCGSAGTYNLEQPEIADQLGAQKARAVLGVRPDVVATGNIGCLVQLAAQLGRLGASVPVLHTVELLKPLSGRTSGQ